MMLALTQAVSQAGSKRASRRNSQVDLQGQLAQIQEAYRMIQADAAANQARIELSALNPGIPVKRVPIASTKKVQQHALSPGELYDVKRRELSALTLELIMTLNMQQILNMRHSFEQHGGVVSVAQFVAIMASHLDVNKLKATPDMLIRSLVELFDSMDLDGDGELEFEELLTTVVHMGMAATEHLLLTPISPYRDGPQYLVSMNQIDRSISFIREREAICVVDQGLFAFRLYDPAMKHALAVELPLSSALSVCYVTGVQVDMQQQQQSYKRSSVAKASYYTSGAPSASAERAKLRAAMEQQSAAFERSRNTEGPAYTPMWDRLAGMPLSKPMRMEGGQPVQHRSLDEDEKEGLGPQQARAHTSQLFSEHTAKPYYNLGSSLHAFTEKTTSATTSTSSSNASGTNGSVASPSSSGTSGTANTSGSSSSASGGRTPLIFIHEDFLVTSTSQHLQIWSGFPTGPAQLCDTKKIRHSYSYLKWCPILQRLFAGDVLGNIDVWKIILLPQISSTSPPSKPSLLKEKELHGHTDIITGLESIPSMGFLLSSSLDASVRMFDLQSGTEKNRFIGHRAGVVALTYSNEYRFLLSAGSDHQVCVWSPFAEKQVYSLRGHTSPLIGVQFVPGTPQIVTGDSSGIIKIWDARNFSCCQTFSTFNNITSFTACSQRHKRIFAVGKNHEMYIYEQEGGPFLKRKKEESIFSAIYSTFTMTMLTASREDLKVFDGLTGNLSRVYRGLAESDLTAVCLDARQRKIFVGDTDGRIRCYNYLTGAYMKSLTPHLHEEIIALAYSGSRRLLVSATDRNIYVHDERPIEEQILYMTTSSAEGTEYLVISVSEKLSSLACAMSNGKIDLWNLDQAMRDVPLQGYHPDVITAMLFLDSHHLLLSADDSGSIMAWFVRPSRWKGQLAFELHTPPMKKETGATTGTGTGTAAAKQSPAKSHHAKSQSQSHSQQPPENDDPIRKVTGLSTVPGISSMGFHAPSNMLFCGHRNGSIQVWNLKPLLDFLTRVSADATASWFVTAGATTSLTSPTSSTAPSAVTSPQSRPRTGFLNPKRGSNTLALPDASLAGGNLYGSGSSAGGLSQPTGILAMPPNLPIKDQLALMASALRPCNAIQAHEAAVATLHVVLDPPALITTSGEHVAHVWSLTGEPMGELDSVVGLAKGYASSAGIPYKGPAPAPWEFSVNVAAREQKDRATTHAVLQDLEQMAVKASSATVESSDVVEKRSRPSSSTSSSSSVQGGHARLASAINISLLTPPSLGSPIAGVRSPSVPSAVAGGGVTSPTGKLGSPTTPARSTTTTSRISSTTRRSATEEKEQSSGNSSSLTAGMSTLTVEGSTPQPGQSPVSPGAPFFLSTPMSPVVDYNTVTKGVISPSVRAVAPIASATSKSPSANTSKLATPAISRQASRLNTTRSTRPTAADEE